jgi:hypothetical protein
MRKWILLLAAMITVEAMARDDASIARVYLYNCDGVGNTPGSTITVRIGAAPGETVTLAWQPGNYFEGPLGKPAKKNFPIAVDGYPSLCCTSAELLPKTKVHDWILEYVVSCDSRLTPWSFSASSDLPGVKLRFAAVHPVPAGTLRDKACDAGSKIADGFANLGKFDVVNVRLSRDDVVLVKFPVSFTASVPKNKKELAKAIDQQILEEQNKRGGATAPEQALIDYRKFMLPESIRAEKR